MKSTMNLQKSIFLLDGRRGTYIPQEFAEDMLNENLHSYRFTSTSLVLVQMLNELAKGQDNEFYWENWSDILCYYNEIHRESTNELFYLTQGEDGDLWLVHEDELAEWNAYESGEEENGKTIPTSELEYVLSVMNKYNRNSGYIDFVSEGKIEFFDSMPSSSGAYITKQDIVDCLKRRREEI